MSTRVIHARMKDRTIYGAVLFLQSQGISVEGKPMSTVVSLALDAFVNTLGSRRIVNLPDPGDCTIKLNTLYGRADALQAVGLDVDDFAAGLAEAQDDVQPTTNLRERLREAVRERAEKLSTPAVEADDLDLDGLPTEAPPNPGPDNAPPPWPEDLPPFSHFALAAPRDVYVEWLGKFREGEMNKEEFILARLAMRVAYSNLTQDMWGTDVARRVLMQLTQEYKPWLEHVPDDFDWPEEEDS